MTSINSIQNMKNTGLGILFLLTLTACASQKKVEKDMTNANTESKDKSVLLVGMYHFNSPGLDTYNLKTDDYTSSKRQSEIEEVVELLAAYKPTKIFIEFMPNQQKSIDTLYSQYLKDEIQLNDIKGSINEVYQIGFRLGKKMDGIDVTAIDSWGNWLGPYADFIADTLNVEFYKEAKEKAKQQHVEKQQLFLSNTVRENIIYLNKPQEIIRNHSYYNDVAIKLQDTTNSLLSYQEKEEEIDGAP